MMHLCFKAAAERKIVYNGDLEICMATGDVEGCGIESDYKIS